MFTEGSWQIRTPERCFGAEALERDRMDGFSGVIAHHHGQAPVVVTAAFLELADDALGVGARGVVVRQNGAAGVVVDTGRPVQGEEIARQPLSHPKTI